MDGAEGRARPVRRRAPPAVGPHGVPRRSAPRHRARRAALDRAAARLDLRRGRRLHDRPAARHRDPRDARHHLAAPDVGGFWIGRYGETTARDRFHAPYVSVAVVTALYLFGQLVLQFMLGEPAPAGLVAHGVPGALLLNLILTLPGVRAHPAAVPAARARRPHPRGAAPWLTARAPSRRFLPGDPRVAEPYRLTPQLALRVAILGFFALALFAVLFLRLWALQVLSGERYLAQANDNRVRTLRLERRAARSSTATAACSSTNTPGTRVELWPSDLPKTWPAQRAELRKLAIGDRRPDEGHRRRARQAGDDPLTPVVVQRGHQAAADLLPARAPGRVPRRPARATATCASTRTSRSPRRCSATSAQISPRTTRR